MSVILLHFWLSEGFLIRTALEKTREYRKERNALNLGLQYPTTPRAWHETHYLQLRQDIFKGTSETVKLIEPKWKRSPTHQILVQALTDIFQYGYKWNTIKPYNDLLDQILGYH